MGVDEFLDISFNVLLDRCPEVETQAHLALAFGDYIDAPFDRVPHPLSSLVAWPDKHAGIGKYFAF